MDNGKRAMRRFLVVVLLGCALVLLAGCGGRNNDAASDSSDSGTPAAQPTKKVLPTMPAARFAAPTSMIRPQGGQAVVEATATMTATEAMTETEVMTATEEMTSTEEITATEAVSETE